MKKILFAASLCTAIFTACQKDNEISVTETQKGGSPPSPAAISPVPASFTQKALIEEITDAYNGKCPETSFQIGKEAGMNPNKVIAIALHQSDALTRTYSASNNAFYNQGNTPNTPSAMVSRFPKSGNLYSTANQVSSRLTSVLGQTASCGLAIETIMKTPNWAQVDVHAGFNQALSGQYNVTAMLVESSLIKQGAGYDQNNIYNTVQTSPFYMMGNPIQGYDHQNVVQKVLTADMGDPIHPVNVVPFGSQVFNFQFDIPSYFDANELYIVAFINKVGSSPFDSQVMNVQKVQLGQTKDWD